MLLKENECSTLCVNQGGTIMDWMDFNRDGEVDAAEMYLAEEMLCTSKEEHEALFGDAGDFEDDEYEEEDE